MGTTISQDKDCLIVEDFVWQVRFIRKSDGQLEIYTEGGYVSWDLSADQRKVLKEFL